MELDNFKRADNILCHINYNSRIIQRIDDFLSSCNDRVSALIKNVLGDDYDYSRLDNVVDDELKAYRDRLENEIEQLKKEFEEL